MVLKPSPFGTPFIPSGVKHTDSISEKGFFTHGFLGIVKDKYKQLSAYQQG